MNEIILKENVIIENMIYEIRGKQVMLDSDLAKLYCVETKRINEAVKRNPLKFPERFSWILTNEESKKFLVENCDQKNETRGGRYKNPRVFTEQGVAMLATILKSKVAIEVSISIMDAFVLMRQYINNSLIEQKYINELVLKDTKRIDLIESALSEFKTPSNHIFFKGQIYDAHSTLVDILNKSEKEIIIIDNYINKNILDILRDLDKQIIIITNRFNNSDYYRYQEQYNNIKLIVNEDFHDRFIIIDRKTLYHCGSSFKDLGKKCFEISLIDESKVLKSLLDNIPI